MLISHKRYLSELSNVIHRLRDINLPIRFITNTTKESKRILLSRLTDMGGLF